MFSRLGVNGSKHLVSAQDRNFSAIYGCVPVRTKAVEQRHVTRRNKIRLELNGVWPAIDDLNPSGRP
jgi:hypothetical protein